MDVRLAEWFAGRDTGLSSKSIALFLSAGVRASGPPSDGSDFGRCYRLLEHMGWRDRIGEMADHGPMWATYVARWDDIEKAYLSEINDKVGRVYDLMKLIEADAYEAAGYAVARRDDGTMSSAHKQDAFVHDLGGIKMSGGKAP